jgi:hypothetical protein
MESPVVVVRKALSSTLAIFPRHSTRLASALPAAGRTILMSPRRTDMQETPGSTESAGCENLAPIRAAGSIQHLRKMAKVRSSFPRKRGAPTKWVCSSRVSARTWLLPSQPWIPAFAGMTASCDSLLRGDGEPACHGLGAIGRGAHGLKCQHLLRGCPDTPAFALASVPRPRSGLAHPEGFAGHRTVGILVLACPNCLRSRPLSGCPLSRAGRWVPSEGQPTRRRQLSSASQIRGCGNALSDPEAGGSGALRW